MAARSLTRSPARSLAAGFKGREAGPKLDGPSQRRGTCMQVLPREGGEEFETYMFYWKQKVPRFA